MVLNCHTSGPQLSQCTKFVSLKRKLEKCEQDDTLIRFTNLHPYSIHKFANRMRSTHHAFGLQFLHLITTERGGVHNLQTGWHLPPVHLVNNLWTGLQDVRFSNFKKWEPDGLIRMPYQKLQKFTKIKNFISPSLLIADTLHNGWNVSHTVQSLSKPSKITLCKIYLRENRRFTGCLEK